MKFPVLAVEPKGFTWVFQDSAEMERMPVGFIGIYRRRMRELAFYDYEGVRFRLSRVGPAERVPFWWYLTRSLQEVRVTLDLERQTEGGVDRLREDLRAAIESDDDILTQFIPKEKALPRLSQTKSVSDVFRFYFWIRKDVKWKKKAQPGATDNPDDAQRI